MLRRLGHVALRTRDKARMVAFYRDFLGMRVVYDTPHSAMVRLLDSEADCGLVFMEVPEPGGDGRVDHLGFNVASRAEVDAWAKKAEGEHRLALGPLADAYIGYFCIVLDPEGNHLEFSAPEGVNIF